MVDWEAKYKKRQEEKRSTLAQAQDTTRKIDWEKAAAAFERNDIKALDRLGLKVDIRTGRSATGATSTITGKPVTVFDDSYKYEPAKIRTHVKAGFVDDPRARIKLYAKDRFPEMAEKERLERYAVIDGKTSFLGDDGNWYAEIPDWPTEKITAAAAGQVAQLPAEALAVIGSQAGPVGAGLGAAAGESFRRGVGALAFGDPQTPTGTLTRMAAMGAGATGGELIGRGAAAVTSRAMRRGGPLAAAAGRKGRSALDIEKTRRAMELAQQQGIDLPPAAASQTTDLINQYKLLGDLSDTAQKITENKMKLAMQSEDAFNAFLNDLTPDDVNRYNVGSALAEASKDSLERLTQIRTAMASPKYKEAFLQSGPIDISPVADQIDDIIASLPETGQGVKAMNKAKRLLYRTIKREDQPKALELDDRLEVLNEVKKEIDNMIERSDIDKSIPKGIKRDLTGIKEQMLAIMDLESPLYQEARRVYQELSPMVDKAKKGILGPISKLESDKQARAIRMLLSSTDSTPQAVMNAKKLIIRENPEVWRDATKVFLRDQFEEVSDIISETVTNIPGQLYKKLYGKRSQRKILKAALEPKRYQAFSDLMSTFKKAGVLYGKESTTTPRAEATKSLRSFLEGPIMSLITGPKRALSQYLFEKNADKLAEAMFSEKAAQQLLKMRKMSPGSKQFMTSFGAFVGALTAGEFTAGKPQETMPEVRFEKRELLRQRRAM